jgi:type VII secretion integral membrane protein EccD
MTVFHLGVGSLLLGSATLLLFSLIGYTGVAAVQRLFMAGVALSLIGLVAALCCLGGMSGAGAAAIAMTLAIGLLPSYPLIASWLGKLPRPDLPDRPEEILADRPVPPRADVFAAVARTTELLTGMLLAAAITGIIAGAILATLVDTVWAALLAVSAAAALLLRSRLFALPQQRIPLLVSGAVGLGLLVLGLAIKAGPGGLRLAILLGLVAAAAVVLGSSLLFSRRNPSPYFGRAADILDVVAIMALIPLTCAVVGVFSAIQGLFASIGG